MKVIDFSDDEESLEEGHNEDAAGQSEATKGGESREKDSRSRRGTRKRSRSSSEESAEDSESQSSSSSVGSWDSQTKAVKAAKEKGGAGFVSSDGSPQPRRKRRFAQVSSSSSEEEEDSGEVHEGQRRSDSDDSPETRARKVAALFEGEDDSSSSPQSLEDHDGKEEDGKGECAVDLSNVGGDVVRAVADKNAEMVEKSAIPAKDAPAGTGGEDELKKSDPVGARPSLGLHPDVSHREFFNE